MPLRLTFHCCLLLGIIIMLNGLSRKPVKGLMSNGKVATDLIRFPIFTTANEIVLNTALFREKHF